MSINKPIFGPVVLEIIYHIFSHFGTRPSVHLKVGDGVKNIKPDVQMYSQNCEGHGVDTMAVGRAIIGGGGGGGPLGGLPGS